MIEKTMRPLNLLDLCDAYHLPVEKRRELATPIIEELKTLEAPAGIDAAGIPIRGRSVFEPYLDGRTTTELAATYVELQTLRSQRPLIDEVEVARGIPAEER